ncbi:MAG: hypothetical protein O2955_04055 [Planctomycetota bacterium]|nr:hypothetical protein [Planctomycetota bacterium]MDA1211663.1 hypothetical protein [Planctomycetota bacterium]
MTDILWRLLTVALCFSIFGLCGTPSIAQTKASSSSDDQTKSTDDADDEKADDKPSSTSKSGSRKRRSSSKREKPDEIGPLSESPLLAMEVRDDGASSKLREHGEEVCIEAEKRLKKFEEMMASNQLGQIDAEELGTTHIPLMHLDRVSRRLSLLGEPSGWELGSRHMLMSTRLKRILNEYRNVPKIAQQLSNTTPLAKVARRGEAQLVKVDQLIRKNNFDAAETLMDDINDSVYSVAVLYSDAVSNSHCSNINAANSKVQPIFSEYRRQQAVADLEKEQKRSSPDFKKLLKELQEATATIASGSDPQVGSRKMSGPEWLDHFSERWQHLYFEANRCFGLDITAATIGAENALAMADNLASDYENFISDALQGIAALIRADAGRMNTEQAATVYAAYLQSIARFGALADLAIVESALLPALDALVVKSPELQADAGNYYLFSTELLRWRQRVADGYVAAKLPSYQGVNSAFYQAVPEPGKDLTIFDGNSMGNTLRLMMNAPHALQAISPGIVTKKVYAQGGLASRNELRRVSSYEEGSVYASIPNDVDLSLAVEELKSMLLVTDDYPPLTLDATLAIETATHGDLWQFGGEVTDIELEGRITKITNASPDDWGLFYLTMPLSHPQGGYSLQHVMAHCHVRPDWMRHRYFFVELN